MELTLDGQETLVNYNGELQKQSYDVNILDVLEVDKTCLAVKVNIIGFKGDDGTDVRLWKVMQRDVFKSFYMGWTKERIAKLS